MHNYILVGMFWILAIYGLIELVRDLIYIYTVNTIKSDGMYLIVAVKNQEDKIECFLRSTIFRLIYGKEQLIKEIIIVDLKSQDNTSEIIDKISNEHEFIRILNWDECKELIENIEK